MAAIINSKDLLFLFCFFFFFMLLRAA